MTVKVYHIAAYLEELAPPSIALPGDLVGLQVGDPYAEVEKAMVALDPDRKAIEEAVAVGAKMLITHHPLFYSKLSALDESLPLSALAALAIRKGLNIFSLHTNYDVAPQGVSFQLAKALGFAEEGAEVLEATGAEQLLKLVVFVPAGYENAILDALASAGAAQIGNYSHCTFMTPGTGTFMPGEGTSPYLGSQGQLEKVEEIRLETILPAKIRSAVIKAVFEAHPYEEVAYDLYPLDQEGRAIGLGLLVDSPNRCSLESLVQNCKNSLQSEGLRYFSAGRNSFRKIAICGGSGGSLIGPASRKGAEILISGDFSYHDLQEARHLNLALIDAGHDYTERPAMAYIRQYLEERLEADRMKVELYLQAAPPPGWKDYRG